MPPLVLAIVDRSAVPTNLKMASFFNATVPCAKRAVWKGLSCSTSKHALPPAFLPRNVSTNAIPLVLLFRNGVWHEGFAFPDRKLQ